MGLQARVQSRIQADPVVALHLGIAPEGRIPRCHRLAGRLRRVRHQGPGRGGPPVGRPEVQTPDELRQAEQSPEVFKPERVCGFLCVAT